MLVSLTFVQHSSYGSPIVKHLFASIAFLLFASGCTITVTNEADDLVDVTVNSQTRRLEEGQTSTWNVLGPEFEVRAEAVEGGRSDVTDAVFLNGNGTDLCYTWNGGSLNEEDCP